MMQLMTQVEPLLRQHAAFAGFVVFGSWWFGNSLAMPAPVTQQWPASTGIWYINNLFFLDPDPAGLTAWLRWAASRNLLRSMSTPRARLLATT